MAHDKTIPGTPGTIGCPIGYNPISIPRTGGDPGVVGYHPTSIPRTGGAPGPVGDPGDIGPAGATGDAGLNPPEE